MRRPRPVLVVVVAALALMGATGCVTSTPTAPRSPSALPSLAASLPPPAPVIPADPASSPPGSAGTAPATAGSAAATGGSSPGSPKGTTARPADHVPSAAELRKALLGSGDLSGFKVDNGQDDGVGGEGGCPALDTDFSRGASAKAETLLYKSSQTVFIRERLRQLTVAAASRALTQVRGAPRSCGTFTTTVNTLGKVTVTVAALGVGKIGDGSAAVRITMRPAVASLVVIENLVAVRRGATLILLAQTSVSSIDDGLTSTAAARADAKTRRVW